MIAILGGESVYVLLFLAGISLLVGEALAPGTHFFVLGIALFTAGLVGMVFGPFGTLGLFLLALLVIAVTGLTLWGYRRVGWTAGESVAETSDSESLRGKFGYVTETVTPTSGEVKLENGGFNPYYRARSTSGTIDDGEEVMVVDPGGGNVVTVESVTGGDDIDRELARAREQQADGADGIDEAGGDGEAGGESADGEDTTEPTADDHGDETAAKSGSEPEQE